MMNRKEAVPQTRKQLQATIKELKAKGLVDKKFDARQNNEKLATEIGKATGTTPGIDSKKAAKKSTKTSAANEVISSFKDAQNLAERKGFVLQHSAHGFKLELYTGHSGRPEKFLLPSDVVKFINKLAA